MMQIRLLLLTVFVALPASPHVFAADAEPTAAQLEFFEKRVRPVLVDQCYSCHSHDAKKLKAGLYVDSREGLLKGGDTGPAMAPGTPEKSLLIEAVSYKNVDLQMPPKTKLSDQQIADLTEWVKMGSPWPKEAGRAAKEAEFNLAKRKAEQWAWQGVKVGAPPAVKNREWPRNAIDQFVLAKLEGMGLSPAADADPRTLIRRVYLDLIGLPPATAEVEAFVKDWSANKAAAYERIVDSLLASPRFGEKWARHWLDLARFAETCGHEFDYPIPHAWRYRDYVIRALNEDVPYNQFVMEHIAGDLLPNPRRNTAEDYNESIIATGFWFLHEAVHAPVDVKLDEATRIDNQIDVFSKTFLGLTVACARCHDHKFDPISTKDYYALYGFFASSPRQEAMLDPGRRIESAAKKLAALRARGDALAAASGSRLTEAQFKAYLLAAYEVLHHPPKAPAAATPQAAEDVVFEDFESGTYRNWTITGTAFGDKPQTLETTADYQGKINAAGKFFVNSHNIRRGTGGGDVQKGDDHKGTMVSRTFTIERDYISMLVGGGSFAGKTCINLVIDGKAALTATGKDNNQMFPVTWNVRALRGKKAAIHIIDDKSGGWGNIGFDQIVFTNKADEAAPAVAAAPDGVIDAVAKARQLDAALLKRWAAALSDKTARLPTHPLFTMHAAGDASLGKTAAERLDRGLKELKDHNARVQAAGESSPLFESFDSPDAFKSWSRTGEAFGQRPTVAGQWNGHGDAPGLALGGVADSGALGDRLQGVLRSKTFTLDHRQIHYRVKGTGQIRLIINHFVMDVYNGLLFSGASMRVDTKGKWQWITQGGDVGRYTGERCHIEIIDHGGGSIAVDEIRLGGSPPPEPASALAMKALSAAGAASVDRLAEAYAAAWKAGDAELLDWALRSELLPAAAAAAGEAATFQSLAKEMAEIDKAVPAPVLVQAVADGSGFDEHIFIRGGHRNPGPPAPRQFLEAIDGPAIKLPTGGSGRLELAQRVVDPANPFTSRVLVNRLWHHLFGRGIVPTTDDFGVMGLPPTHPQLLDWLADDFVRRQDWSIKKALRQIVLSRTYQMASARGMGDPAMAAAEQADATNELLHRFPIRRLPAETLRDQLLAVSGRLNLQMYGPSVPVHLTPFMEGRGRPGGSGPLDGDGRRSVYMEIRRNFLPPMLTAFDFPTPYSAMGRRTVSNVPAQALILMNDPFVVQQAELWARRVLAEKATPAQRITSMFTAAFSRPPRADELARLTAFIAEQSKQAGGNQDDLRVWKDVAHVLFNMKEFAFVN